MRINLGNRYRLTIIGLVLTTSIITAASLLLSVNTSTKKLLLSNETIFTEIVTRQAINHTSELAQQLTLALANPLYFYDIEIISELLAVASAQSDITQILVLDKDSALVRDSTNPLRRLGEVIKIDLDNADISRHGSVYQITESTLQVYAPIQLNDENIGYLLLSKSLQSISDTLASQRDATQHLSSLHFKKFYVKVILIALLLLILGLISSLIVSRRLTKPIAQLLEFAHELSRGNYFARAELHNSDEFNELAAQLNTMAEATQLHNSQLEYVAHHDHLTGLRNRRYFKQDTIEKLALHPAKPVSVLLLGIDDFKMINDIHGHNVGDIAIAQLGKHLEQHLLSIMSKHADCAYELARFTGDKFVISLQSGSSVELANEIAKELISGMSEPLNIHGLYLRLTISIGIAVSPEHGKTVDKLINNASTAMYLVKENTKNNVRLFNQADEYRATRNSALLADFSNALETKELELWYQPQYSLETKQISGVEALLRWNHPHLGTILPGKILSLIERHELIHKLAIWTLKSALAALRNLSAIAPRLQLSVNMSPEQLLRNEPFEILQRFALKHPDTLQQLTIEVTETLWTASHLKSLKKLQQLQALGIRISLDDFGTGYSSISLLKSFPISEIKLDQTFVRNIDQNTENYALSSAILGIAKAFEVDLIAEGVETQHELDTVAALGCKKFQGFLFNAPMPMSAFITIINDSPEALTRFVDFD